MIKAHLHESPELHVESANKPGVVDFYVDKGGNLVGRKLSQFEWVAEPRHGGHDGDRCGCALPRAAELAGPLLHYNFGRALSAGLPVSP